MQETLYIENFGPIKKATLDLRQAMVFIGPQSSGKSTIAKLISIMRDWDFVFQQKPFADLIEDFNLKSFIKESTILKYSCSGYSFSFENKLPNFSLNQEHELFELDKELLTKTDLIEKVENRRLPDILLTGGDASEVDNQKVYIETLIKRSKEKNELILKEKEPQEQARIISELDDINKELVNLTKTFLTVSNIRSKVFDLIGTFSSYSKYIPAERILISLYSDSIFSFLNSNLTVPKTILNFGALFQTAKQSVSQLPLIMGKYKYANENGVDFIYYNDEEKMKLSESSSGIQTLLPLLIVVNHYSTNSKPSGILNSYIIEEPEQNLYPKAQKDLVYFLTSKCIKFNEGVKKESGLIVTTHSPYTLTSFNNLLFAYQVAKKKDKEEVTKIIAEESWVNPDEFNAYFVADGTIREIFNRETGLIDENELDSASEEIMGDFEELMEIYKGIKA